MEGAERKYLVTVREVTEVPRPGKMIYESGRGPKRMRLEIPATSDGYALFERLLKKQAALSAEARGEADEA